MTRRLVGFRARTLCRRFMYKNAGHLRRPTVFLFTEAEIKDEVGRFSSPRSRGKGICSQIQSNVLHDVGCWQRDGFPSLLDGGDTWLVPRWLRHA